MKLRSGNKTSNNPSVTGNVSENSTSTLERANVRKHEEMGRLKSAGQTVTRQHIHKNGDHIESDSHVSKRLSRSSKHVNTEVKGNVDQKTNISNKGRNIHGSRPPSTSGELIPHDPCILLGIKIGAGILILMYFIIPVSIRLSPGIMADIAFLQRVRWPPFLNLSQPAEVGLNGTRNFWLASTEGITLGAWHILPQKTHLEKPNLPYSQYEKELGNGQPVMFYLHGNAGTRGGWHRVQLYKFFSKNGFHTVTFDYRGYADSTGYPSEDGFIEDAMSVYNWVRHNSAGSKLYIWGHSMGTGVATKFTKKLCTEGIAPLALFLESPFNNLIDAAMSYPLAYPFKIMPYFTWVFVEALKYNNISFSSDIHIAQVTIPVLILHAKDDGIVPWDLGVKLYEKAIVAKRQGPVEMVSFESRLGYGHKHIHKAPELSEIVMKFIADHQR